MIEFVYGHSKYKAASRWEELSDRQRLALIPFSRLAEKDRTLDVQKTACRLWLGVSGKQWVLWRLATWQWHQLKKQFGWIFTTRPTGKPADHFEHNGVRYILPEDHFATATALEVALCNMAFLAFADPAQPDPKALDQLIAILCRPERPDLAEFRQSADWNGDRREVWNETRMQERATALAGLALPVKVSVLDYFERMNNNFLDAYSELFGGHAEPRYGDGRGWIMMLKNVAKENTFGNFDAVCAQPVNLVWAALLDDVITQREEAEAQKKHDTNH